MDIIGIDISKAKFDAALLLGERVRHAAFSNTEAGFGQLLAWLAKHRPDPAAPMHACMEATGTRRGNVFLKSALFAAASAAVRTKGSYYRDKYNRLRARRGPVRAILAIAHKLLIAAFHMLSTGEVFRDLGEGYLDQVARKRSTAKLVQRLSNLGYDVMLVPKTA